MLEGSLQWELMLMTNDGHLHRVVTFPYCSHCAFSQDSFLNLACVNTVAGAGILPTGRRATTEASLLATLHSVLIIG